MADATLCAYCFTAEEGGLFACPDCQASHHRDCWAENAGCAVTGCSSSPGAVPQPGAGDGSGFVSPHGQGQQTPQPPANGWGGHHEPAPASSWGRPSAEPASTAAWGQAAATQSSWSVPAAPRQPVASVPAGWYADPSDGRRWRWFDGREWTQWVSSPAG